MTITTPYATIASAVTNCETPVLMARLFENQRRRLRALERLNAPPRVLNVERKMLARFEAEIEAEAVEAECAWELAGV